MPVAVTLLSHFAALQGLTSDSLRELGTAMSLAEFPRRGVVLARDEAPRALGFLIDGRLQGLDFTLDGREVGLYFVAPGDCFGELAVMDGAPMPEDVIALTRSQVAFLPRQLAREWITTQPQLAEWVMQRLCTRVRAISRHQTLLNLPNPFQRLCSHLWTLAQLESACVPHAPTHQELAIMINTSRETVTRAFQVLQAQQVVAREGDRLRILRLRDLEAMARGELDARLK